MTDRCLKLIVNILDSSCGYYPRKMGLDVTAFGIPILLTSK